MKLIITKESFLDGLQSVQNSISERTSLPILHNVLLQTTVDALHFCATDTELFAVSSKKANVLREGKILLPAKKLKAIVKELPPGEIHFCLNDKNIIELTSGKILFKLLTMDAKEFPLIPLSKGSLAISIPQAELKDALKKTAFACSTDIARYMLCGTLLSIESSSLDLVATDGHRLAKKTINITESAAKLNNSIVPAKTIQELQRLLHSEGTVEIRIDQKQISFSFNETQLISNLIDANYPNYKQFIEVESSESIKLARESFLGSLRRISLLSDDETKAINLKFSKDLLEISCNDPTIGEAKETLAIDHQGKEFSISFRASYLIEPLRNLTEDFVFFEIPNETGPSLFKVESSPYIYVVMPLKKLE